MQPKAPAPRPPENKKKKDILLDVLLGALEEIRTPDLLIRSQTLYPTELPAQVQDIYYHRPRGLSTVFAKKFKIFSRSKKRFFCPPSGGGRRAFFSAADSPPAPPAPGGAPARLVEGSAPWDAPVHPVVSLRALRCPCAPCGALRALRCPPVRPCGAPMRSGVPLARSGGVLCVLQCSLYALALPCGPPAALRRIAPRNTERVSPPPRGGPLPRPAAHGREKARPLQKERPGLVHFAVRR